MKTFYARRDLIRRFVNRLRVDLSNMVSVYEKDGRGKALDWVSVATGDIAMMYTLGIISLRYEIWLLELVQKRFQECACSSEHSHS